MSEIPADISEKAYELAFAWAMPEEAALTRCADAIARAILAERERCAKIAEEYATKARNPNEIVGCASIAIAIRNPESK